MSHSITLNFVYAILFLLCENSKYNMECLYITGYPLHAVYKQKPSLLNEATLKDVSLKSY